MANKKLIIDSDINLDSKTILLLLCTAQELNADITRTLKQFNLSFIQLQILHALAESDSGELTVNQIKSALVDESPNVSRALNKLMKSKFIRKVRNMVDQRVVYVKITEEGKKVHLNADKELLKKTLNLESAEKELLYKILVRLS